jgi:TPR repeat protein
MQSRRFTRWSGFLLLVSLFLLSGCMASKRAEELQLGKSTFQAGNYKDAFHQLLPLASDGKVEAEYAVGYMYYYGYGVAQDAESGIFWMKKAADQGYPAAVDAMRVIEQPKANPFSG